MKKFKSLVLGAFILGLVFLFKNLDLDSSLVQIRSLEPGTGLALGLMQLITMGLLALQWNSIIGLVGGQDNLLKSLLMNSYGNIVDGITPGAKLGGEISRAYYIKNNFQLSYQEAGLAVGLQKTISSLSFFLLYLASLIYFLFIIDWPGRFRLVGLHLLIVLLVFSLVYLARKNTGLLGGFLEKIKLRQGLKTILDQYKAYLTEIVASPSQLGFQLALGFLIWALYPLKMYLIVRDFQLGLSLPLLVATTYISYMVAMLPLLPGSLGSFESSMVYLLSFRNILLSKSFAISFIFRFFTFWFEMLVSLILVAGKKLIGFIRRLKGDKIQT